jgi:hypothetical protein
LKDKLKNKLNERLGMHDGPKFIELMERCGLEDHEIQCSFDYISIPADKIPNKKEFQKELCELSLVDRAFNFVIEDGWILIDPWNFRKGSHCERIVEEMEERAALHSLRMNDLFHCLTNLLTSFVNKQLEKIAIVAVGVFIWQNLQPKDTLEKKNCLSTVRASFFNPFEAIIENSHKNKEMQEICDKLVGLVPFDARNGN